MQLLVLFDQINDVWILCSAAMYDELHIARKEIREKLSELCVKVLSAYRANCASSTSPGQLILPEAFKLLPVYTAALLRSKALRGGKRESCVKR
jgi:protein transport protein SEC24